MSTEVISSAIQERTAMTVAGDRSTGNFGHRHGLCIQRLQFNQLIYTTGLLSIGYGYTRKSSITCQY